MAWYEHIIVTDAGPAVTALGAAMNGDVFPDGVVVAHDELGALPMVLEILRVAANMGEWADSVGGSHSGRTAEHCVWPNLAVRADAHLRPDDRIGPHDDGAVQLGMRVDDGTWMNFHE
ncbi:MAG: hypothetical protein P8Y63_07055 [Deltaproteobacteria bacterium]